MKKKILALLLTFSILFAVQLPAFAASGSLSVSSSKTNPAVGDEVTLTVSMSGTDNATSMALTFQYDTNAIEIKSGEWLKTGSVLADFDKANNAAAIAFTSATDLNGNLFKLVITVKSSAAKGNTTVTVKPVVKNGGTSISCAEANTTLKVTCKTHRYGNWEKANDSQHKHTCSECGHVETANHIWNNGTITKQPTCKDTGVKTFTCTACNATKTETIAKTNNHTYGSWTTTKEATCTSAGTQERNCSICGKKETKSIAATGHSYGSWKVSKEATCTAEGTEMRTCSKCGNKETRSIKALGHNFTDPEITKKPTCTEPGIESGKCARCGQTTTQEIEALGHKFGEWKQAKAATCTDKGTEERTGSVCQQKESRDIPAVGHDFENPVVVKEATISSTGLMEGKCKRCGETTQEVIPCQTKDEATGIRIEVDEGVFSAGSTASFSDVSTDNSIKTALNDYGTDFRAYGIDFVKDGTAVKPNGEYNLILPNSDHLTEENIFVCLIATDGTVTEKQFELNEDGTISVKATEAGTYAVVNKSGTGGSESEPNTNTTTSAGVGSDTDVNTPNRNSNTIWIIIAVIAAIVIAGGIIVAILMKKRKNN